MFKRLIRNSTIEPKNYKGRINYPSGVALYTEGFYYLVKSGKLYRFGSDRAFQSWSLFHADCLPENIEHLKVAGILGFREGTLLSKFSDGTLHIVSANKTRHITDPDALDKYGLLGKRIFEVSDTEFNLHDVGEELDG